MKTFLAILLLGTANARPFRVEWQPHPDASVREFRVYRVTGAARTLLATSPTSPVTVEANHGDALVVTAYNGAESAPSAPVTIPLPPAPPTGLRVVEIQTSSNLKDWETIAYVPVEGTGFVRARTTSLTKP